MITIIRKEEKNSRLRKGDFDMDKISHEETKEKKNKRAPGIVGSIKHSIEEAKMKREAPLLDVITFFITFLFARCHVVFGSHPLAIAFIAVLPTRVWLAMLGAVSGALTIGKSGIIYSMISVIVVFLRIVVSGTEKEDEESKYFGWFSERLLLKMSASLIGGFIAAVYETLLSGLTFTTMLFGASMIIIPPLLVFAISGLFDAGISFYTVFDSSVNVFSPKGKSEKERFDLLFFRLSGLLMLFLISISLKEYDVLGISLAYIFAGTAALIIARRFGALYGCIVGFASSFGLSSSLSVAFALAGIAAGGLFPLGLGYGVVGGGALLGAWAAYADALRGILSIVPEYSIAALIIFPVLKGLSQEKTEAECEETERSAMDMVGTVALSYRNRYKGNLTSLEMSLFAISGSIKQYNENSTRPTREELSDLILECADKYCRACEGRAACMTKGNRSFIENTKELADILYTHGRISETDLGAYPEYCHFTPNLAEAINRGASILAEEKFREMKKDTSSEDFGIVAKLINEARIEDEKEKALNESLSDRLKDVMLDAGMADGVIRAFGERRPYFILAAEDESGNKITAPELKKNIEHIADVRLGNAEFYRRGKMTLMECPSEKSFAAECAVSSIAGEREDISGDTAVAFESESGYFYSLISDGMGSGKEAKETSAFVADFMQRALEFSPEGQTVLKILNHTIRHRHRECSATVDLFTVDLYRGDAEFLKSGAAASYVKRGSSIFRIKSKTAPLGLMKNVDAEKIKIDLEGEDYIIMLSDGIAQSAEDTPWLLDLLSKPPKRNLKEYADSILSAALKNMPRSDDMTVLVTRVIRKRD